MQSWIYQIFKRGILTAFNWIVQRNLYNFRPIFSKQAPAPARRTNREILCNCMSGRWTDSYRIAVSRHTDNNAWNLRLSWKWCCLRKYLTIFLFPASVLRLWVFDVFCGMIRYLTGLGKKCILNIKNEVLGLTMWAVLLPWSAQKYEFDLCCSAPA